MKQELPYSTPYPRQRGILLCNRRLSPAGGGRGWNSGWKGIFLFLQFIPSFLFAQTPETSLRGEVSYLTSRNVYVKFERTDRIAIGDTLKLAAKQSACLLVTNKSSTSCVCTVINACEVSQGEVVVFDAKAEETVVNPDPEPQKRDTVNLLAPPEQELATDPEDAYYKEKIRGRVSVASYHNIASERDNRHRLMGRFSLNANHIRDSKFSFESYLNYRHIVPSDPSEFELDTRYLRVFNLAVKYEPDPSFSLILGRRINPKTASLGAIDGLQAEKYFGNTYVGAILGSRPDILTFAPNFKLLEYGGYVGTQTQNKRFYSQTTLGFIEQRNGGNIDRRYVYFQHSSTIARNLILFSSLEMDMYSSVNGVVSNALRLPSLYVSGTYRFGRKVNLMVSYDSRKRILYYDTFQTEIERLLDDDLARQGVRARLTVRPVKYLSLGGSYAQRFQSDQQNKSDNLHGFVRWSNIPAIGGRLNLTYNRNASNYLTSNIYSARYSKSLLDNKLDAMFYYRMADYLFVNSDNARRQHYYGTNLSLRFNRKLSLGLSGELATFNEENNFRIYLRLIRRFSGNS